MIFDGMFFVEDCPKQRPKSTVGPKLKRVLGMGIEECVSQKENVSASRFEPTSRVSEHILIGK